MDTYKTVELEKYGVRCLRDRIEDTLLQAAATGIIPVYYKRTLILLYSAYSCTVWGIVFGRSTSVKKHILSRWKTRCATAFSDWWTRAAAMKKNENGDRTRIDCDDDLKKKQSLVRVCNSLRGSKGRHRGLKTVV